MKLIAGGQHRRLDMLEGDTIESYYLLLEGDTNYYRVHISDKVLFKTNQGKVPKMEPVVDDQLTDTTILGYPCRPQKYHLLLSEEPGTKMDMYVVNWYASGLRFASNFNGPTGVTPLEDSMILFMQRLLIVIPGEKDPEIYQTTLIAETVTWNSPVADLFRIPADYRLVTAEELDRIEVTDVELEEIKMVDEETPPPPPPPPAKKGKKKKDN